MSEWILKGILDAGLLRLIYQALLSLRHVGLVNTFALVYMLISNNNIITNIQCSLCPIHNFKNKLLYSLLGNYYIADIATDIFLLIEYFLLIINNLKVKVPFLVLNFIYRKEFILKKKIMLCKMTLLLSFLENAC